MKNVILMLILLIFAVPAFAGEFSEAWICADNAIMFISQPDKDPLTYNVIVTPRHGASVYAGPSIHEDEMGKAEFLGEYKVVESVKKSGEKWLKIALQ